jgi:hypothetical protein
MQKITNSMDPLCRLKYWHILIRVQFLAAVYIVPHDDGLLSFKHVIFKDSIQIVMKEMCGRNIINI